MSNQNTKLRRGHPLVLLVATVLALIISSAPISVPALAEWRHNNKIYSTEYMQKYGRWDNIDIPDEFKLNAMHAALLPTGKVLLVAGSGNNRENFDEFYNSDTITVLKTALLDPETMEMKLVDTPSDLFCSGHAFLQSGSLLVAGGTTGYELLEGEVKKPAGAMVIHNEDPDSPVKLLKKGTRFISPSGKEFLSTQDVSVEPASKVDHGRGHVMIHHSSAKVFVEAISDDSSYITDKTEQYSIAGLKGSDKQNIYGQGGPMTLNKQDFRGDNQAYEFDPIQEKYIKVGSMHESRWYPSLPVLTNGDVLAVSGLDNTGVVTDTSEYYSPDAKKWSWGPTRMFPTYPALFRTLDPEVLFYSGSSAGYGAADVGREPGLWNIESNSFAPVPGLRYPEIMETSASVMLPPTKGSNDGSQSYKIMVAGGGGVGESELVTARTDIIDLLSKNPTFQPGPDLPAAVRYLNMTVTPWDEVFATGGNSDYRAKGGSYKYQTYSYNPTSNLMTDLADAPIGRGYHSGSILLADGRILVFGGDPLFSNKENNLQGKFEQRIEIFTPPQFYKGSAPLLEGTASQQIKRGQQLTFKTSSSDVKTARLIPPSSTTHVTNIEQRSVAAIVKSADNGTLQITIPADENMLPNGWYMLFVTDSQGIPSQAKMVQVIR